MAVFPLTDGIGQIGSAPGSKLDERAEFVSCSGDSTTAAHSAPLRVICAYCRNLRTPVNSKSVAVTRIQLPIVA